ncbi:MAG: YtxH domain-containing protein [Bacteroides sp.]|nr:YtxH domain-containing protein [Bacteroides sp.]
MMYKYLIGIAAGAVVAYALSRKENRKKISKFYDEAWDYMDDAMHSLKKEMHKGKKHAKDMMGSAEDRIHDYNM